MTRKHKKLMKLVCMTSGIILFAAGCAPSQPSQELLARYLSAKRLYENGDLRPAFEEFKSIVDEQKSFYQARFMQGKAAFFMGNNEEALTIFKNLREERPEHFDARYWLAKTLQISERPTDAENEISELLSYNSDDFRLLILMAQLRAGEDNIADAIDYYRKALLVEEDLARAHLGLAKLYYDQGVYDRAESQIDRAIRLLPDDSPLLEAALEIKKAIGSTQP